MMYKVDFARTLKRKVRNKEEPESIGRWASSYYFKSLERFDLNFENLLLALGAMESGPEFAFSYERLNEIADDLLMGEEKINLDY